jgi:CRISPR-associated endonuclease/helicase Cas3
MTEHDPTLLQFWGKTPQRGEPASRFHPALFHMLDVAFVAEALLHEGAPRLRRALTQAWRGCDPEALIAWLPFLIATHDLGKISAAFQGQDEVQRERLRQAGVRFNSRPVQLYHAEVSALWLHQELIRHEPGTALPLMHALRDAMGGHHGRFAEAEMPDIRRRLLASEQGEPRWTAWRERTYALLRELLAPPGALATLGAPAALRPATVVLTGFIVWCDWMGSNERDFRAAPDRLVTAYGEEGRRRARAALAAHGLRAARPAPAYPGFAALFPEQPEPRPLQSLVEAPAAATLAAPTLTVIEAPTGEGKTEAALALARRIAAARGIDEIFFALPTMATGNQMFLRLQRFYHQQYGADGAVKLTHSQAVAIEDDLRQRVLLSPDHDRADLAGRSADAALEWFAGPKKAMLAPFGVGTVDQVELGGLSVRHYPLRLFGLAGKVVVIDEVHAYDAYMSTILDHTLTWLAALGCSVIMLSATLPRERHRVLARAFLRGLGSLDTPDVPAATPYPAVSRYGAHVHSRESCAVFRGEQRFTLRLAPQRTPAAEADHLLELVRDGGAVARLCNRVDDAQALYAALLARAVAADARVLLHARFPLHQRQQREGRIETLLGRHTARTPGQPLIVVGTQVLEQSLDYDVDVMVSDFAPVDLLLQRAGRLHRHDRAGRRPPRHAAPVLEVTYPRDEAGRPDWRRWERIYAPYVLWRTLAALNEGIAADERSVVLPRDYRPLIEAVYGEGAAVGPYAAEAAAARARYERETSEQEAQARRPLIPDATGRDPITFHGGRAFIEDEAGAAASWQLAKTRLGDRVTLVPVFRVNGELALDPSGTFRIPSDATPTLDQQKDLLSYAVPVSDRRVIAAYRDEQRPRELRWPWPDLPPLLRSLHPLPLDPHTCTVALNGRALRLDAELGLVLGTAEGQNGFTIEEDL